MIFAFIILGVVLLIVGAFLLFDSEEEPEN